MGDHPVTTVLAKVGASANVQVQYSDVPAGSEYLSGSSYVLVTPPDERTTMIVPVSDITPCRGRVPVTPVPATAS